MSKVWKPEHDEALRALMATQFSFSEAAILINHRFGTTFTRNAAIGRAHRLGIDPGIPPMFKKAGEKPPRKQIRKPRKRKVITGPILVPLPLPAHVVRCEEVEPLHIRLIDNQPDGCCWPYGDGPFTFCGHLQTAGSKYCLPHFMASVRPYDHRSRRYGT